MAVLPYADKNVNWSHGSEYRVEFNAGPAVPVRTNATSNGTGSSVTSGGAIPEEGDPEYSGFGNVSNTLAYWEWGLPVQTDDFQWWDVTINCADLIPYQVDVDKDGPGTGLGPFLPPYGDPVTEISVLTDQPVNLTSNVLNQNVTNYGPTFVNRTSTIMFWNETAGLLDWNETGHTMPVPAGGAQTPSPNTAMWPGSPTSGIFILYITVDYPTEFTEYNAISGFLPPYGNITEVDDTDIDVDLNTNNTVRIRVRVGDPVLPDLIPGDTPIPTDILFNNTAVTGATGSPPVSDQIEIKNDTGFQISSTVTNVGNGTAFAGHTIAFYNCTQFGGQIDPPFYEEVIMVDLGQDQSSNPVVTPSWRSPVGLDIHSYICIEVDYYGVASEYEENNNTYIIHVHTTWGEADLNPYDVIIDDDIKINAGSFAAPVTGNMSITITTGQVIEIYTKPSNDGDASAGSFDMGFFNNVTGGTTPEPSPSYTFNVPSLAEDTTYNTPQTQTYVKYYNQEGTYYIFLWVDYNDAVLEGLNEGNNILTIEVHVFDLPPPPSPWLDADDDNGNVSITWSNVTDEDIVSYNIYWAESPEELNFTTPQATVVASGTSITYNHLNGVTEADELYYVVCSVDVRGWEGPSSDIMGKFTMQIPAGYSTFSLPFEPFVTNMASWYLEDMNLDETDAIFSYDAGNQKWIPHPRFLPDTVSNFDLTMGETYMLFARAGMDHYTFTGYPGTTLRYIGGADNAIDALDDPRLGVTQTFRDGLWATEDAGNIVLTWSWDDAWNVTVNQFESLGGFNIYRATSRAGFNFTDAPYATITQITATWTDQNADGNEYYYMVVPTVELTGREGSSALAIGVKRVTYEMGYSDFTLYLRPRTAQSLSDHLDAMGLVDAEVMGAIFWFDSYGKQRWIPHPAFLPDGIADPNTDIGQGNMIYLLTTKDYTMIGR
jgi:hypothetical protein